MSKSILDISHQANQRKDPLSHGILSLKKRETILIDNEIEMGF